MFDQISHNGGFLMTLGKEKHGDSDTWFSKYRDELNVALSSTKCGIGMQKHTKVTVPQRSLVSKLSKATDFNNGSGVSL